MLTRMPATRTSAKYHGRPSRRSSANGTTASVSSTRIATASPTMRGESAAVVPSAPVTPLTSASTSGRSRNSPPRTTEVIRSDHVAVEKTVETRARPSSPAAYLR
jgi:hypothetical protein